MAPPRLLRGLIAPLPLSQSPAECLPCHHRCWVPSLARLRCYDGFKLFLVLLLAEVRYVASAFMAPTLRPGDRAGAEKVSYMFRKLSIGDIVFFRVPTALQYCGINKDVVFIKRVIATPGDFIQVRQGQLSLLLTVLHRMNITPRPMRRHTRWKPWSRDTCMPKLPWLITTTQTNDYAPTATARGGPKVAWLLRVVDFLSTPIILSR